MLLKRSRSLYVSIAILSVWFLTGLMRVFASTGEGPGGDLLGRVELLVLQLSLITAAAWAGGTWFRRCKLPSVLGEILAGVIIGPYVLGGLPLAGFEQGLFPIYSDFPVSIELYSVATVASILLLFFVGLETDLDTFLQFSVAGSTIGLFGGLLSFALGDLVGMAFLTFTTGESPGFFHPVCLFFGVISTATSVSITARILHEKRRMNAPDGVTILSAAVIDDIFGIIALAAVIGLSQQAHVEGAEIARIAGRTIGIWLVVMLIGLALARRLSRLLHLVGDGAAISLICLALALFVAGMFEKFGLAMIIGAYTVGLIFSKTDLAFLIQDTLSILQRFLVPVFFCVMGMFIDPTALWSPVILGFSAVYIVIAVLSKFLGCYLPALLCGFNRLGACRIGVGMIPRGEVALIVAGVGLSKGIIDHDIFSIAIVMTFFTTLATPPLLQRLLRSEAAVLRKGSPERRELIHIHFDMPNPETAEFIQGKILQTFRREGFFAHRQHHGLYLIRKRNSFISMKYSRRWIDFECLKQDETFVHVLFYEVISELEWYSKHLQSFKDKQQIAQKIINPEHSLRGKVPRIFRDISPFAVETNLKGGTRDETIQKLIHLLVRAGQLNTDQTRALLEELKAWDTVRPTGIQKGVAMEVIRTEHVQRPLYAFGVTSEGVDFNSLDGELSRVFLLCLIPRSHPTEYLEQLSEVSDFLSDETNRSRILSASHHLELVLFIKTLSQAPKPPSAHAQSGSG